MARFSARAFAVSLVVTLAAGVGGVIAYRELNKPPSPIPDLTGLTPDRISCVDATDRIRGREAVLEDFEMDGGGIVRRITILGHVFLYVFVDPSETLPKMFIDETGKGEFRPLADVNNPPVPAWVLDGAEALRGQRIAEHCVVKYEGGG